MRAWAGNNSGSGEREKQLDKARQRQNKNMRGGSVNVGSVRLVTGGRAASSGALGRGVTMPVDEAVSVFCSHLTFVAQFPQRKN